MNNVRLLPVVVMAIAALLVFKTLGLVTNGGYVLGGTSVAMAAGASSGGGESASGVVEADATVTPAGEPTMHDTNPVLTDTSPTLADGAAAAGHGSAVAEEHGGTPEAGAPAEHAEAVGHNASEASDSSYCFEADVTLTAEGLPEIAADEGGSGGGHGASEPSAEEVAAAEGHAATEAATFAQTMSADCFPSGDAVPLQLNSDGTTSTLANSSGTSATEQLLLERLATRRTELEQYEQDLVLRASIVDAAEQRINERTTTLQALEAQIASLVNQREEMESGQFAGIVAMYEAMKPKDAANIFNNLDMEVLLRVAKSMSPRKMAPVLAVMDASRAQELTVRMADLADQPVTQMTAADLSALPQIVGQ